MKFIKWLLLPTLFCIFICFSKETKKIAFIKQVTCPNLYCCSKNSYAKEIVFSSFKHSGPVALFTKFDADFYIVETESDEECMIWTEKVGTEEQRKKLELLRTTIPPHGKRAGHKYPQGYFTVHCQDINWSDYDIVISVDISIPARITAQYPKTLWCYYVLEGCPSYRKSLIKPIKGYDVFLTQDFFQQRQLNAHVLDFPLQLHYYGCFKELYDENIESKKRTGINLEVHTKATLTEKQVQELKKITTVTQSSGAIKDMIKGLMQTKYYIQYLGGRAGERAWVRGNGLVEAIATGNLVIARESGLHNKDLLSPKTFVHSFEELVERIRYFESHPSEYLLELEQQRKKLDFLCYYRPMKQLFEKHDEKMKNKRRKG